MKGAAYYTNRFVYFFKISTSILLIESNKIWLKSKLYIMFEDVD